MWCGHLLVHTADLFEPLRMVTMKCVPGSIFGEAVLDHGFFCQKTDQTPDDVEIQVEKKEFMDEFFAQVGKS